MADGSDQYPKNWKSIAAFLKQRARWRCVRCGSRHVTQTMLKEKAEELNPWFTKENGWWNLTNERPNILTVHHMDGIKQNCDPENLIVLCQVCHLKVQHFHHPDQLSFLPAPKWLSQHLEEAPHIRRELRKYLRSLCKTARRKAERPPAARKGSGKSRAVLRSERRMA